MRSTSKVVKLAARVTTAAVALSTLQAITIVGLVHVSGEPLFSLIAGSAVVPIVVALALWGRHTVAPSSPTRRPVATWATMTALTLILSGVAYLAPSNVQIGGAQTPAEQLRLKDGATLSVRRYRPDHARTPLVLVHGGPGVPFTQAEEATFAELANDHPVVTYDQVGSGASSRLKDPTGYTLRRATRDLAAVVDRKVRAKPILIGHSWGAGIALTYAAEHPQDVAGLILLSPGPFPWADAEWPAVAPQTRLTAGDRVALYSEALKPRNLFWYALTAVDPSAATWFGSDVEMDARFARLYRRASPGLTCDRRDLGLPDVRVGAYASQVPQLHPDNSGVTSRQLDELDELPVLIVRGECDYVPLHIATTYAEELGGSFVELEAAGHSITEDEPDALLREIRQFLGLWRD